MAQHKAIQVTYRGWRGDLQIHWFENQIGCGCKLNNFTTIETQFSVIIKYSVHILNPNRINGTIKYQPFSIRILEYKHIDLNKSRNQNLTGEFKIIRESVCNDCIFSRNQVCQVRRPSRQIKRNSTRQITNNQKNSSKHVKTC